jgi:hypothetical protein
MHLERVGSYADSTERLRDEEAVLNISGVDPRTEVGQDYQPVYRVYFWGEAAASYEYELAGAEDVDAVIAWAEENRGGRTYTVYAVARHPDGPRLLRLRGVDPTRSS